MPDPRFTIPFDRLPEGFARSVDAPPDEPARPRPAATIVLLRPADPGPELLLVRRVRSAGFVPGAWVFPGGRVDADDATEDLVARVEGLAPEDAADRLGLPSDAVPPAIAYYVAAVREAFEETGILVGRDPDGRAATCAAQVPEVESLRDELMEDDDRFPSVLDRMGCRVDGAAVAYVAHWITPVAEPRRYDTRFFAAAVPEGTTELLDAREMSAAVWLTPREALERNRRGELPMVFPTVKTLEDLTGFGSPDEVLDHFNGAEIPAVLPRLVRTPTGVGIEVDAEPPPTSSGTGGRSRPPGASTGDR